MKVASVILVAAAAGAAPAERYAALQAELQGLLDGLAARHPTYAIQLGWKSAEAEFSVASGQYFREDTGKWQPTTTDDLFLFGSGTKPYTAAAVVALAYKGVLSLDDPAEKHLDPVLGRFRSGATLQGMFGANASRITVGHLLRMQSGVQDFDFAPFDNFLLLPNETYKVHTPFEFVDYASQQPQKLVCDPGSCVSYSSNNLILAGMVLLAHAPAGTEWYNLDIRSFLDTSARPSLGASYFFEKELLSNRKLLTVPGRTGGGWAKLPNTTIWNQSSTILGWTCGNMASTSLDVARFFWDLLGPNKKVLPAAAVAEMTKFKPLDLGWAAGGISYGAGLMVETSTMTARRPPTFSEWGTYMGHGGDTYGFLSEQGILWGLNASVSIVTNQDSNSPFVSMDAMCNTIQTSARVLLGLDLQLRCLKL